MTLIYTHVFKLKWLYNSKILKVFAPYFKEIELLFGGDHGIGTIKDRLDKLRDQIFLYLDVMTPDEFELIAETHCYFYMCWLACICYYGGGSHCSLDYMRVAQYN